MQFDKTLIFLFITMFINAVGYGIIIPLFFPYAQQFGMGTVGLALLFASFSMAQFIATPIIGRLSDKYGRRPLLLISILGTSISLAMFAMANTVLMLFIARILDGLTGGNVSVAQAVIADKVSGPERSKALGMIGAGFGFGFLIGPAIGGVLSQYGLSVPFWFASGLALASAIFGFFFLKETRDPNHVEPAKEPITDVKELSNALFDPVVGRLILITLLTGVAYNAFIIGFQGYTNVMLQMTPTQIGFLFSLLGVVTIIMQAGGIRSLLKLPVSHERWIVASCVASAVVLAAVVFTETIPVFVLLMVLYGVVNSPIAVLLTGTISHRTHGSRQGMVLGVNQSYNALGQIVGPLIAGLVAHRFNEHWVFVVSAVLFVAAAIALYRERKVVQPDFDKQV